MSGKIGIMDSGIGGLTVVREIMTQIPGESIVYIGDNAYCPYGDKSKEQIKARLFRMICFLKTKEIKLLIVACNTATALFLEEMKQWMEGVPVIGVIHPGAMAAVQKSRTKRIGVIATTRTIESGVYNQEIQNITDDKSSVFGLACPSFVPMIESGTFAEEKSKVSIKDTLSAFANESVDTLILGCTHYPWIKETVQEAIGEQTIMIDPSEETARFVKRMIGVMEQKDGHFAQHEGYTTGDADKVQAAAMSLGIDLNIKKEPLG